MKHAFIDPMQFTAGELRTAFLAQQLQMVGESYNNAQHLAQAAQVKDILHKGLHRMPPISTGNRTIDLVLREAQKESDPAAGVFYRQTEGVSDAVLSGIFGQASVGEVIVPENHFGYCRVPDKKKRPGENNRQRNDRYAREQTLYDKCTRIQKNVRVINEKIAPMSPHCLYNFTGPQEPQTVVVKQVLHRNAIAAIGGMIEVDTRLMSSWWRNGIISNNIDNGLQAIQPEETYKIFKEATQEGVGIDPVLVGVIISIIMGALEAAKKTKDLFANQDQNSLERMAGGFGSKRWGPEREDFDGSAGENGLDTKILLPLAAGALVLFALSSKDKKTAVSGTGKRRGRPRKNAQIGEVAAVETVQELSAETTTSEAISGTPKRGRGRPRKNAQVGEATTQVAATETVQELSVETTAKGTVSGTPKRRGRPRKAAKVGEVAPHVAAPESATVAGKRRGRPRKAATVAETPPAGAPAS